MHDLGLDTIVYTYCCDPWSRFMCVAFKQLTLWLFAYGSDVTANSTPIKFCALIQIEHKLLMKNVEDEET